MIYNNMFNMFNIDELLITNLCVHIFKDKCNTYKCIWGYIAILFSIGTLIDTFERQSRHQIKDSNI